MGRLGCSSILRTPTPLPRHSRRCSAIRSCGRSSSLRALGRPRCSRGTGSCGSMSTCTSRSSRRPGRAGTPAGIAVVTGRAFDAFARRAILSLRRRGRLPAAWPGRAHPGFEVGRGVQLGKWLRLHVEPGGVVVLGDGCVVDDGVTLSVSRGARITGLARTRSSVTTRPSPRGNGLTSAGVPSWPSSSRCATTTTTLTSRQSSGASRVDASADRRRLLGRGEGNGDSGCRDRRPDRGRGQRRCHEQPAVGRGRGRRARKGPLAGPGLTSGQRPSVW